MPKKLRSLADSELRPQPDSRMAWARVTEAGTFVSRWLCWAAGIEAARNWSLVMVPVGPIGTAADGVGAGAAVVGAGAGAAQVGSFGLPDT
jgi:hypothetical protein